MEVMVDIYMSFIAVDDDVTVGKFYATFLIQDYFRSYFCFSIFFHVLYLSFCHVARYSRRTITILIVNLIIIIMATIIRRFKKKKENKALTEAPTDKSTVFQAWPSTLHCHDQHYHRVLPHDQHVQHHVVPHDVNDAVTGGIANIARGRTRTAAHNLH